jgi:hypothetical protein
MQPQMSALEAYKAQQAAAATSGANNYYLTGEAKTKRLFKAGQSKVAEETVRILANAKRIEESKNPYFEEVFFHLREVRNPNGGTNKEYELYCPNKNDGEYCPMCAKEKEILDTAFAARKALREQIGEDAAKKDEPTKAMFREANNYQARRFYMVEVIDRARQIEGKKFWFIKENKVGTGIWDKLKPQMDKMIADGYDFSDPQQGFDLSLTCVDTARHDNKGTYRNVSVVSFARNPSPLSTSLEETSRILGDATEWRQLKRPAHVKGYLDSTQFLAETAAGRMPIWDETIPNGKFSGVWVLTQPNGQRIHATYDKSPEALAANTNQGQLPSLEATQMGTPAPQVAPQSLQQAAPQQQAAAQSAYTPPVPAPVPQAQPAAPAGGTYSYNPKGDDNDLPF